VNCHRFEDYLKEKTGLDELKIHMKSCDKCEKAFRFDNQILNRCRSLNDKLVVPDLWSVIEEKIEADKSLIIKFRKNKRLLFAAAAAFLIFTTIWLFNITYNQKPSTRILSDQTLQKVIQAESTYIEAINELESLAYAELEDTTEPLAQLYRNKLSLIDHQIQNCKKALETNPANSHIRRYLMTALQDKRKTLEKILKADG
jgi:hypothetical protein